MNAKQAAIRAGYSPRSAEVEGSRLLKHAKVSAAIGRERREISKRTGVTPERVVTELAKLGFSDIRKALSWRSNVEEIGENEEGEPILKVGNEVVLRNSADIDDDTAAAITEISQTKDGALKVKLADKRAALVDIGRHLGMFKSGTAPSDESGDGASKLPAGKSSGDESWDGLLQ
ncbi:phage terminase small subunit [Methylobacterium sp. BE186]|uniref:terminase small subunit n=1 Tax=Methylobacterium sp. BE186 TaxID=2817715 RepID=UPI0028589723|nr:phage terminase small subunit [Methylobacterium sp. BE186]